MSNKLDALPLGVSSQSTSAQSSPSVSTSSTQTRYGTPLATSSRYVPVQGASSSNSFSLNPPGTLGQYAPGSPTKYASARMSSPQASSSGSSNKTVSQVGSQSQMGATGQFTSQGGSYYSGLLPQSPATSSQSALGYSKLISSPQRTSSQSASVLSSHKQYASASQGSFGAQFGASTGFASQGMSSSYSGSVQSQGTTGLYCKCALSSQGVDSQSTIQSSRKQFTSGYGTQSGSKTFTLQGSIAFDGSPQPQGSSGTQAGSSTPFTLQGSTAYGGAPQSQDSTSQFARGPQSPYASVSLSSPQGVTGPSTVQSSRKQFTSVFRGSSGAQFGASTGFAPESVNRLYSGSVQSQDPASQFAPGSKSSYASVSLFSPQAGPSTTVQGSRKQFTSTFTGSSGSQAGSSTRFSLQGSTAYGGSPKPQDATSRFAPGSQSSHASVSLSSPQAGPSTTVQSSRNPLTSTFTSGSGTQAGSSTPFPLQGSTTYGGSPQPQDTAGTFAPGSLSSYASVSLSSPQAVAGPSMVHGSS
ncbi:endochitinase A-like [Sinocyclocheilus grahami]|uniref:endochitinase A-like n=1 Tax=Sinocyclocheilus grahami TaxID=75366 RepID=UPI0007AD41AE|nr:PREDICTED: endochitinase A-like [Sinocyclocheilus grahami]